MTKKRLGEESDEDEVSLMSQISSRSTVNNPYFQLKAKAAMFEANSTKVVKQQSQYVVGKNGNFKTVKAGRGKPLHKNKRVKKQEMKQ